MRSKLQALLLCISSVLSSALSAQCLQVGRVPSEVRLARVVALGETHGTVESPRLAGGLVCALARAGTPVVLALEIPSNEQLPLDEFISGGPETRFAESLRASPFWARKVQDGRSSEAMLALLRQMRSLRTQGAEVSVVAIDAGPSQRKSGSTRDESMAANLTSALESHPQSHLVALLGSVHARRTAGTSYDPAFRPAIHLLAVKPLLSLQMAHTEGEAWVCQGATMQELSCGATRREGNYSAATSAPQVLLGADASPGYDGYYFVGTITASPPAVATGRE